MSGFNRGLLLVGGLLAVLGAGPAWAQENLDADKSPAQLFAADCVLCHKTPKGLAKAAGTSGLEGFLREHYTASKEAAAAIAGYLRQVGGEPAPAKRGRPVKRASTEKEKAKDGGKPAENKREAGKSGEHKPAEAKSTEPKLSEPKSSEPKSAKAKKDEHETSAHKPAEKKPAEHKATEHKPAEGKAAERKTTEHKPKNGKAKAGESKPATAKTGGSKSTAAKKPAPKDTKSD